jgi:EAL domain-containing protein (putative c-di-GMP-specific phosphodiesterase class I)
MHNENLGHRAADLLLQDVGARISETAGVGDLPIRFGGDQFVLITPANNEAMHARFSRLIASFEQPFIADGLPIRLSVSAGIVEWDPHTTDFEAALYQAEQACIAAKDRGRDRWVAFGAEDRQLANERRRVARVLADAIAAHKVFTHVQPIIDLATGAPVGFEMLARLADTPSGVIMPSVFIPIAEESSLIDSLGMSVLRSTCQLLASSGSQLDGMTANVNVSLRQLMRDGFPKAAAAAAAEHGVAPSRLCLEITESQWLDSDGPARNALLELKAMGFRLALDDFGTGYASLRLLQSVPFDVVKIDRSFTQCLGDNGAGTALCEAALRMAAACGMRVTAEGVETQEQADLLRVMGCQQGQGYWWSRPLPSADAIKWIEKRQAQPVY